jgi:hypothetical protein
MDLQRRSSAERREPHFRGMPPPGARAVAPAQRGSAPRNSSAAARQHATRILVVAFPLRRRSRAFAEFANCRLLSLIGAPRSKGLPVGQAIKVFSDGGPAKRPNYLADRHSLTVGRRCGFCCRGMRYLQHAPRRMRPAREWFSIRSRASGGHIRELHSSSRRRNDPGQNGRAI